MNVAVYARVSTGRQEREQTIESQLCTLQSWAHDHGYALPAEHIYSDEGWSGARLDRPALDRLRDAAQAGVITMVGVLSPDRLARKYAYQVLLLEEFRRVGCTVVFLHHPLSDDPNDQLLLQIQGAMAEYERALLQERFRRGRLQKLRAGHYVSSNPPYGYRYIPKSPSGPGYLVINEAEADVVRTVFGWLVDEAMTMRQIIKRLNYSSWRPRCGTAHWGTATLYHLVTDPVYTGTAYFNRYSYQPPQKPRRPLSPRATEATCRRLRPREEWIGVSVPALIDEDTYQRAQRQLARNAQLSFRHNTHHSYLLRCLLSCGLCGLHMFGRTYPATATAPVHRYYRCKGRDVFASGRAEPCAQRTIKAEELEQLVWTHVVDLLSDPAQLVAQFEQFSTVGAESDTPPRAELQRVDNHEKRLRREDTRLVDAYQAGVLSLAELEQRRQLVTQRQQALREQRERLERLQQHTLRAHAVREDLAQFCERIRSRLPALTLAEQQTILQLVIDRIVVGTDTIEIHHVIPLHLSCADMVESDPEAQATIRRLRSDGASAERRASDD